MSLQGLPDFQQPLIGNGFQVYFPYEAEGFHVVVPSGLEVAARSDGKPDFVLDLVRGVNPMLPPAPYGVLDFRVRPSYRMEEALALARSKAPRATLGYPSFTSSFLRFQPAADTGDLPADMLSPVSLGWNGLETTRFVLRVSAEASSIIKRCLENEVAALLATAVVGMEGVSPRVPAKIRFQPPELLTALAALGENRIVARDDVAAFFRKDPSSLPVKLDGALKDEVKDDFAEAMADLVRIRYASAAPAPKDHPMKEWFALPAPEAVGPDAFEWDLSEPQRVSRGFVLSLDPFAAAKQLVASEGVAAVVRETVVPQIQTGTHQVWITANLPAERPGVLSSGVTLRAPAAPPFRLQPITLTAEFQPPADSAMLVLRLAPQEQLQYTYATFVVWQSAGLVERLDGPQTSYSGERLELTLTDFPVDFLPLEASQALLGLAAISGVVRGQNGTVRIESSFSLTPEQPSIAHPLPKGATAITVEIEARAKDGPGVLHLSRSVAGGLSLGLSSFREYGAQTVDIECDFSGGAATQAAIDLLPEGDAETAGAITVLSFTPAKPRRPWTYAAESPFRPGYRYRMHPSADESAGPWSEVMQPGQVLQVTPPLPVAPSGGAADERP